MKMFQKIDNMQLNLELDKIIPSSYLIDDEELKNGDKTYRINLYGKNLNGEWSKYG